MRVLVVKTSSLGDVVHTLPALTDAKKAIQDIQFDWVVEEAFADIPAWHPAVDRVIPVALRRWRKHPFKAWLGGEWGQFKKLLREREYDYIIDAQGLIKSAFLAKRAEGQRHGLDRASAREPWASRSYDHAHFVAANQHAIARVRKLFAASLRYPVPASFPDYGLDVSRLPSPIQASPAPYVIFLHGTTWPTKHWPEQYWNALAGELVERGFEVRLPWGSEMELQRAQAIAASTAGVNVLPSMGIAQLASLLQGASFVVGVDTGLAHLCAALEVPSVTIYGSTRPELTGVLGKQQKNLQVKFACAPCLRRDCQYTGASVVTPACYGSVPPARVLEELHNLQVIPEQEGVSG